MPSAESYRHKALADAQAELWLLYYLWVNSDEYAKLPDQNKFKPPWLNGELCCL